MSIIIKKAADILPSEITDQKIYQGRRDFIKKMSIGSAAIIAGGHMSLPEAKTSMNVPVMPLYRKTASAPSSDT